MTTSAGFTTCGVNADRDLTDTGLTDVAFPTAIVRDRRRCGSGPRGSFVLPLEGPGEEVDESERCAVAEAEL